MKHPLQRLFPLALILLVLAVFHPSFEAEFVQYDDPAFITHNGYVNQGLSKQGIQWAFSQKKSGALIQHEGIQNVWHPLTWISHMTDVELFGLGNPGAHHAVSVIIHALSVMLLYFCLVKLKTGFTVAALVSAFFAVHPMHVESVAWVSERKDVLSGMFFFATILAYLHQRKWLSVGLFILALMCKPSVVALPCALMLIDWWKSRLKIETNISQWTGILLQEFKAKLPWIIPVVATIVITILSQYSGTHQDFILPLSQRLLLIPSGLLFYFGRTFWPIDLSFHYPHPQGGTFLHIGALILVVMILGNIWRLRKRFPHLLFGVLWFLLLWFPTSGLIYTGTSFTADRYSYLAHVGLFLGIFSSFKFTIPRSIFVTFLLSICATLAYHQVGVWKNSDSLFSHAVKAQPRDVVAMQNLAGLSQEKGDFEQARTLYEKVITLEPHNHQSLYNVGNCYRELNQPLKAKESYEASLKAYPTYLPSLINLAGSLIEPGTSFQDIPSATLLLTKACELSSYGNVNAVGRLFVLEHQNGQPERAQALLKKAPEQVQQAVMARLKKK